MYSHVEKKEEKLHHICLLFQSAGILCIYHLIAKEEQMMTFTFASKSVLEQDTEEEEWLRNSNFSRNDFFSFSFQ